MSQKIPPKKEEEEEAKRHECEIFDFSFTHTANYYMGRRTAINIHYMKIE